MGISEEARQFYYQNYVPLVGYNLVRGDKKMYIGSKTSRTCRYCQKSEPETTFKMKAHAIPEMLGNTQLIAYDECDGCNVFFSDNIEDHFAKFTKPYRLISQVRGKEGVPAYKSKRGSRINFGNDGFLMQNEITDSMITLRLEEKEANLNLELESYIPAAVFKCFVKMALAIFPLEELPGMQETIRWIKDPNHQNRNGYDPLALLWTFFPGPYPTKGIHLFLLKRKDPSFLGPSFIFIVVFAQHAFQIVVPAQQHDRHLIDKKFTVYPYPFLGENNLPFSEMVHGLKDLSSPNVVRGEKWDIVMHMENYEEMRHENDD